MTALSVVQKQELKQETGELSPGEVTELNRLEGVIEKNLRGFYEVGTALIKIREGRLYRSSHDTFEEYCQDKWDMGRNYMNKLIASASVVDNLGTVVPITPINEAQTRPLTKLETPELQQQAWKQAVETAPDGKVTADHVEWVVHKMVRQEVALQSKTEESQGEERPYCEKCGTRPAPKTNPMCSRCRKEEARVKKLSEARGKWAKLPINDDAEKFALDLAEKMNKLIEKGFVTGKVSRDVYKKISNAWRPFDSYLSELRTKAYGLMRN